MKVSKKTAYGILLSTALLTSFYIATTVQSDRYLIFSIPTIGRYFSVSPTVPLDDVEDTIVVIEWLDANMESESCLLAHKAFLSWARLYLENNHVIIYFDNDVQGGLALATEAGFNPVYFVWWGEEIGWYGVSVPSCFSPVFESGRIAVYGQ